MDVKKSDTQPSHLVDGGASLWLKPEKFLDPNFAPESFVQDVERYVPLDSIRDELSTHLQTLQNRLVEVVNEDYMNFVNLSTNLVDVDASVNRMQRPVLEVKAQVEDARAAVAAKAAQLQDGLSRRQAAAANRALLELAQDAAHVVAKVEKLLGELPQQQIGSGAPSTASKTPAQQDEIDELEARCRLLDRICSEVSRLNFYLAKGASVPLMKQMEPRSAAATTKVHAALDSAMRATLRGQHPAALGVLIHSYASIGQPQLAEAIVKEEIIEPLVNAAATKAGPQNGLKSLLESILSSLKQEAGGFLEFALSSAAGANAYDFLGSSVLPPILSALETHAAGAFSPGIPDTFCSNYKEAASFIDKLEQFAVTVEQIERFRSCEAYKAYFAKWNLAAYFSLRYRDIAGNVEEQLTTASLSPNTTVAEGDAPKFAFAATSAVWSALQLCISDGVFLAPLADRFLRLSLQLFARYATWLRDGLDVNNTKTNGSMPGEPSPGISNASSEVNPQNTPEPSPTGTNAWGEEATAEQLMALWRDVDTLASAIRDRYVSAFLKAAKISESVGEASEAVEGGLSDAAENLNTAGNLALTVASGAIVEKCCGALKQLRGIVATFRMANRSAPTRPSHYVMTILAPLQQFLTSAEGGSSLPADAKRKFAESAAEGIAVRYQQLAEDTLSTVRKTEDSLRRLKSRKTATPEGGDADGEGTGSLDTDKLIAMQLFLDVHEFGRQLKRLELDAVELPAFVKLWQAVAPEDKRDLITL